MKTKPIKRMYILAIVLFLIIPLSAQKPIVIEEIKCSFSHGEHPGFSLTIPEANYDVITKSWIKRLEKRTKSNIQLEGSEHSIFGALIPEISENPLNIYSIIRTQDSAIILEVSFEIKPEEFISKAHSEKEFALVKDHLYLFGKEEYSTVAESQSNKEDKKLKTLEKELSSLENSKTKLEKDIVEEQNKILGYNDKIELLKKDASYINEQIGAENKTLMGLKDEEAKKAKESQIKELGKSKKNVMNEIESLQKKIVDSNSNIHTAELDTETNMNAQMSKRGEIEEQKLVVEKATAKYNTILNL